MRWLWLGLFVLVTGCLFGPCNDDTERQRMQQQVQCHECAQQCESMAIDPQDEELCLCTQCASCGYRCYQDTGVSRPNDTGIHTGPSCDQMGTCENTLPCIACCRSQSLPQDCSSWCYTQICYVLPGQDAGGVDSGP